MNSSWLLTALDLHRNGFSQIAHWYQCMAINYGVIHALKSSTQALITGDSVSFLLVLLILLLRLHLPKHSKLCSSIVIFLKFNDAATFCRVGALKTYKLYCSRVLWLCFGALHISISLRSLLDALERRCSRLTFATIKKKTVSNLQFLLLKKVAHSSIRLTVLAPALGPHNILRFSPHHRNSIARSKIHKKWVTNTTTG